VYISCNIVYVEDLIIALVLIFALVLEKISTHDKFWEHVKIYKDKHFILLHYQYIPRL
jgi:hypothetical protein